MIIHIDPSMVAMILATKKIEKKYKAMGFSPYKQVITEFVGQVLTDDAKKDYDKHYHYFYDILISRDKNLENNKPTREVGLSNQKLKS